VRTFVNGELRQDGHTRDLIFSVPEVLAYVSRFITLQPGDLVLTGTPDGVGPLHPGDVVEVTIDAIGTLRNQVAAGDRG
jgi:2-keto-4-pentenoate hydratase/2-oxohepta-3-ene-1,7-dioic acid hydratase in catechol pathway